MQRQNSSRYFSTSDNMVILFPLGKRINRKIEAAGMSDKDGNIQINYGIKTSQSDGLS